MRKELIDASNELMLSLLERKFKELAQKANGMVTLSNGLPSGSLTRLSKTRLLAKSAIEEILRIEDIIAEVMKEAARDD